jgi:hypothetical protein
MQSRSQHEKYFVSTIDIGGHSDPKMFQLSLTTSETPGNLAEGMGLAQLTKKHGHELSPTSESSSMPLGFRLSDGLLELDSRKQL